MVRKDWERELEVLTDVERKVKFKSLKSDLFGTKTPAGRSRKPVSQHSTECFRSGHKWRARFKIGGKPYEIGVYEAEEEAKADCETIAQHIPQMIEQMEAFPHPSYSFERLKFVKSFIATTLGKEEKPQRRFPTRREKVPPVKAPVVATEGVHWSDVSQRFKVILEIDGKTYFASACEDAVEANKCLELFRSQKTFLNTLLCDYSTDWEKEKFFRKAAGDILGKSASADEVEKVEEEGVEKGCVIMDGLMDEWVAFVQIAGSDFIVGRYAFDQQQTAKDDLAITVVQRVPLEAALSNISDPSHKTLLFDTMIAGLLNRKMFPVSSSQAATVEWIPDQRLWKSRIHIEGRYTIGRYPLEDEATAVAHYRAVAAIRDDLCEQMRSVASTVERHYVFNVAVGNLLGCSVPVQIQIEEQPAKKRTRLRRTKSSSAMKVDRGGEGAEGQPSVDVTAIASSSSTSTSHAILGGGVDLEIAANGSAQSAAGSRKRKAPAAAATFARYKHAAVVAEIDTGVSEPTNMDAPNKSTAAASPTATITIVAGVASPAATTTTVAGVASPAATTVTAFSDEHDIDSLSAFFVSAGIRSKKAHDVATALVQVHDVASKKRLTKLLRRGTLRDVLLSAGLSGDDADDVEEAVGAEDPSDGQGSAAKAGNQTTDTVSSPAADAQDTGLRPQGGHPTTDVPALSTLSTSEGGTALEPTTEQQAGSPPSTDEAIEEQGVPPATKASVGEDVGIASVEGTTAPELQQQVQATVVDVSTAPKPPKRVKK